MVINFRLSYAVIVICIACTLTGCSGQSAVIPLEKDEAYLRSEFCIPEDIVMVSLWRSSDTPGWFGREGLRMVGEFQLSDLQTDRFVQDAGDCEWDYGQLPDNVDLYSSPPSEIPENIVEGFYFCTVTFYGEWVDGEWKSNGVMSDPAILPCSDHEQMSDIYGEQFDHYRVGILDIATGKMIVVFKNYY